MKLCLITNNEKFALDAERAGIDRIMLDLERKGKAHRQQHQNLFLSNHQISSVPILSRTLSTAELVVRIYSLDADTPREIDEVINGGADYLMLPYFETPDEVERFVHLAGNRSRTILLIETKSSLEKLSKILEIAGINEVHIGLNDLTLSLGRKFIFDLICDGTIENMAEKIAAKNIPFGFGGIARISNQKLPVNPEHMLAAQIKLKATRGWLGRSFRDNLEFQQNPTELKQEVRLLRNSIQHWKSASAEDFLQSDNLMKSEVEKWKVQQAIFG